MADKEVPKVGNGKRADGKWIDVNARLKALKVQAHLDEIFGLTVFFETEDVENLEGVGQIGERREIHFSDGPGGVAAFGILFVEVDRHPTNGDLILLLRGWQMMDDATGLWKQ